jgi:hypothetical protein
MIILYKKSQKYSFSVIFKFLPIPECKNLHFVKNKTFEGCEIRTKPAEYRLNPKPKRPDCSKIVTGKKNDEKILTPFSKGLPKIQKTSSYSFPFMRR